MFLKWFTFWWGKPGIIHKEHNAEEFQDHFGCEHSFSTTQYLQELIMLLVLRWYQENMETEYIKGQRLPDFGVIAPWGSLPARGISDSILFIWDWCPSGCSNKQRTTHSSVYADLYIFLMPISSLVFNFLSLCVRSFNISWPYLRVPTGTQPWWFQPSPCVQTPLAALTLPGSILLGIFLLPTRVSDLCPALWAGFTALPRPLCCCSALGSCATTHQLLWPLWGLWRWKYSECTWTWAWQSSRSVWDSWGWSCAGQELDLILVGPFQVCDSLWFRDFLPTVLLFSSPSVPSPHRSNPPLWAQLFLQPLQLFLPTLTLLPAS